MPRPAGCPLDQIFELHGEASTIAVWNSQTMQRRSSTAADVPSSLAASGGVVNEPETWELLLRTRTTVVWLRARPEDHWNRVIAQGDRRPMADNPARLRAELRAMLDRPAVECTAGRT